METKKHFPLLMSFNLLSEWIVHDLIVLLRIHCDF